MSDDNNTSVPEEQENSRELPETPVSKPPSPETTRIQPHLNTIVYEKVNPLSQTRRASSVSSDSKKRDSVVSKLQEVVRTSSVKKVQLQEFQHDITQMTMYNIVPSPRDDRDWNSEAIFDTSSKLPKVFDMRKKLNPPKNQGYQGTCAAHVAACMKEWQERKDVGFRGEMSAQFVYNNRQNQLTTGMYGRDVMNILRNIGCCTEETYPYETIENSTEISKAVYDEAANYKIKSYARVNTIESLKRALIVNGPCYISFPVYNYSNYMWRQHKGEKKLGGHAMTVVGYDKKGFLIRNSWGIFWDMDGYCHYPYSDWGCHYEIWTTIDDASYKPPAKKGIFSKLCSVSFKSGKKVPKKEVVEEETTESFVENSETELIPDRVEESN